MEDHHRGWRHSCGNWNLYIVAKYRLLADHYVGNNYLEAGAIVTTGVELPIGWVPSLSVDPLDSDAVLAMFNGVPGQLLPEVFAWPGGSRFSNVDKPAPSTYWQKAGTDVSALTGSGTSLGLRVNRPFTVFTPPITPTGDGTMDFSLSTGQNTGLLALLEDI
jgi:hypothetical protein